MFHPLSMLLSVLFVFTLLAAACNAFDFEQCTSCVAQGCGFCYRKSKSSSFYKEVCQCDLHAYEYGAVCNDVSRITNGITYGKQKYYGNNNYNNNNNNNYGNDENNNMYGNNENVNAYNSYMQQYTEEMQRYAANDDHFEQNLSGEYIYQKAKTTFQCYRQAEPVKSNILITVFSIIGVVAVLAIAFYLYMVYREKPARKKNSKKINLIEKTEKELPPAVV